MKWLLMSYMTEVGGNHMFCSFGLFFAILFVYEVHSFFLSCLFTLCSVKPIMGVIANECSIPQYSSQFLFFTNSQFILTKLTELPSNTMISTPSSFSFSFSFQTSKQASKQTNKHITFFSTSILIFI